MAQEAFAVMREGMKGKAGIGKLALYGREYLVAVQPKDKGLVMYTMRRSNEVRSMDAIEELEGVPSKVKPDEIKLAKQVIGNFEGHLDLTEYKDAYQEELQRIIDAKIAGEDVVAPIEETPPKVVNLMDALRQSLDRVSHQKKKSAKADIEVAAEAVQPRQGGPREEARPRLAAQLPWSWSKIWLRTNCAVLPGPHRMIKAGCPLTRQPPSTRLRGGLECQSRVAQTQLFQNSPGNSFEILLGHPATIVK